jgi:hypothetical protein
LANPAEMNRFWCSSPAAWREPHFKLKDARQT